MFEDTWGIEVYHDAVVLTRNGGAVMCPYRDKSCSSLCAQFTTEVTTVPHKTSIGHKIVSQIVAVTMDCTKTRRMITACENMVKDHGSEPTA